MRGNLFIGQKAYIDGQIYSLLEQVPGEQYIFRHCLTGQHKALERSTIGSLIKKGQMTLDVDDFTKHQSIPANGKQDYEDVIWALLPEKCRLVAMQRQKIAKWVIEKVQNKKIFNELSEEFFSKNKIPARNYRSCKEIANTYLDSGKDIRSLIVKHAKKGNFGCKLDVRVQEIIRNRIEKDFIKREKKPLTSIIQKIHSDIKAYNLLATNINKLTPPSETSVRRFVDARYDKLELFTKRNGAKKARQKVRQAIGNVITSRVMERVEIDHHRIDIVTLDETFGLPVGRLWLTAAICKYSKVILSLYFSYESPSWHSVAKCLEGIFNPKDEICEQYGLKNTWDYFGLMEELVVDNAMEFYRDIFIQVLAQFDIEVSYARPYKGEDKGSIENWFLIFEILFVQGLKGKTGSNLDDRGDYDSYKNASYTKEEFKRLAMKWVVDVYHQKVHSETGKKPDTMWREGIEKSPVAVLPNNQEFAHQFATPLKEKRRLDHKGVHAFGMEYNSIELRQFLVDKIHQKTPSTEVEVRYNPEDLGYIYVVDSKNNKFVKVPVKEKYASEANGVSEYLHELLVKYKTDNAEKDDLASLGDALKSIDEKAREAELKNRKVKRQTEKLREQQKEYERKQRKLNKSQSQQQNESQAFEIKQTEVTGTFTQAEPVPLVIASTKSKV